MASNGARPMASRLMPLRRGLRMVWDSSARWTVVRIGLIVAQGLLPLAALYLMKLIVDAVAAVPQAADPAGGFARVGLLIAAAALVAILTAAARSAGTLVTEAQSLLVTDHVVDLLQAKSVEVDLEYYEDPRYHDTLHRAQEQAPYRPTAIVKELAQIGQSAVLLVGVGGLLISFHWLIPFVLFLAVLPAIYVRAKFAHRTWDWQRRQTHAQRKARYLNTVLTGDAFAKELRLFNLGPMFRDRFRRINERVREQRIDLIRRRTALEFVAFTCGTVAVFGSFAWVAYQAYAGALTIGDMVMFFGAFQRAQDGFRDLLGAFAGLYENNLFLADLNEFFELRPRLRAPERPIAFPRRAAPGIAFEGVSFGYPGSGRLVLEDVSFTIGPGEHIALVGDNGSGKTTLVKLLCRLYDPCAGTIRIEGVDIRELDPAALRQAISVVFQDYVRYHLSAAENIGIGSSGDAADEARIIEAATRTGADAFISRLEHGYATPLGKQFGGAELSVGEWQKIALARAFLRDSGILVMDEPTSALDAWAEARIIEQFHSLARGRTAIVISHRLSAMRMVDCIYVLDGGRIVECGIHDDLIARQGPYARMFEIQARHYR